MTTLALLAPGAAWQAAAPQPAASSAGAAVNASPFEREARQTDESDKERLDDELRALD